MSAAKKLIEKQEKEEARPLGVGDKVEIVKVVIEKDIVGIGDCGFIVDLSKPPLHAEDSILGRIAHVEFRDRLVEVDGQQRHPTRVFHLDAGDVLKRVELTSSERARKVKALVERDGE